MVRKELFPMPQKRHRLKQIISKLRRTPVEVGTDKKVPEVYKLIGIAVQNDYRRHQQVGGGNRNLSRKLHHFAAGNRTHRTPGSNVDRFADKLHAPVTQQSIHASGVSTACSGCPVYAG